MNMNCIINRVSCIVWIAVCFGHLLAYDPAACIQCRQSHLCNPPECFCCRDKMPLETHNVPQMVFFSFDDAVTPQVSAYYKELFDPSRKNPNGCPISMTLFISDRNTVYGLVKEFFDKGMEIASHSVTHSHPSTRTFVREARKQKENLSKKTGIPTEHIKGWRSPFLEPLGDTQPNVLKALGYEYDATLTITPKSNSDMAITPFTLDYGWPYDCKIKPCPANPHKGFWEVPVVSVKDYLNMYDCVYIDGCNNPPPSESLAYKFLWENFQKYYKTNRAPMGINMHASWFYYPERKAAMDRFIKTLVSMEDVYIVSINQVIEWLKNPTPLHQLDSFQPWNCRANKTIEQSRSSVLGSRHQANNHKQHQRTHQQQTRRPQTSSNSQRNPFVQQQQQQRSQPSRQPAWTPGQRQQFTERARPSAGPPLVPNLPMVRFWWQTPQMMSARNLEIQRNLQIQQAQQEQQRQEALRRQRAEEERRRRVEQQRKEQQAKKEAEQRARQEAEQRRRKELEKKRLEEQKRQQILRQQEQERKERRRLIELQKQKEVERLQMEELKRKERLKQQELERQRKEMLAQQELQRQRDIQRTALEVTRDPSFTTRMRTQKQLQKDIARQERKKENRVNPAHNNVNSDTPIANKLNNILQLKQGQRIQQLEQLSLNELKALQHELRSRLIRERNQKLSGGNLVEQVSLTDKHGLALEILGTNKQSTPQSVGQRQGLLAENNYLNNNVNSNTKLQVERNIVLREFHSAGGVTRTRINKNATSHDPEMKKQSGTQSTTSRPTIDVVTIRKSTKRQPADTNNNTPGSKTMWNVAELDALDVPWKMWITRDPKMSTRLISATKETSGTKEKTPARVTFLNVHTMKTSKPLFTKKTSHPTLFGSRLFSSPRVPEVAVLTKSRTGPSFTFRKTPVPVKVSYNVNKARKFTSSTENGRARPTIKPRPLVIKAYSKASGKDAATTPKPETTPSPKTTTTKATTTTTTTKPTRTRPTTTTSTTTQTPTTPKATTTPVIDPSTPAARKFTQSGQVVIDAKEHLSLQGNTNRNVKETKTTVEQSILKIPRFGLAAEPANLRERPSYFNRKSSKPSTVCQQGVNCISPNCFCKTYTTPYDMTVSDIPQMIYLTIDGSLNFHTFSRVRSLFSKKRKNPNGCPVKGTVFVSDTGSSYSISNALQSKGIEIGMMGLRSRPYTNATKLGSELRLQRKRMVRGSSLTSEQIKGWRSPGFKPTGDEQFTVLSNQSLYDSSLIADKAASGEAKLWPHTLDFGWSEHCEIEQCPNQRHAGVWEVPIIPFIGPGNSTQCEVTDGCPKQPKGEQQTFEYLMNNFNNYYKTNKAPFAIRLKQIWFHWFYHENMKGLMKFLDTVLGYGDVYMTSIWDMIEWIKSPVPLKDISKFEPWQCTA